MKTLQVISHLMSYPGEALHQGLPELAEVLRTENALPVESLRGLQTALKNNSENGRTYYGSRCRPSTTT